MIDRSALSGDVVREKDGKQVKWIYIIPACCGWVYWDVIFVKLGTVVDVDVACNAMVIGTSKTINNISAKNLKFLNVSVFQFFGTGLSGFAENCVKFLWLA